MTKFGFFVIFGGKQQLTALYTPIDWCVISKQITQKTEISDGSLVSQHTEKELCGFIVVASKVRGNSMFF